MSIGPLDKNLPVPLYHQLEGILKAEIESGRWRPDEQIPTEAQLVESFGVSKITVRQALEHLAQQGYIRREHGRGTFVSQRKFDEGPRELTSFSEEMRGHKLRASSRILAHFVEGADPRVAAALGLPALAPVSVLRRLRLANGEPLTVQTAHIPQALAPGLALEENASLYEVLQRKYHLYAARARETYVVAKAERARAKLLGIPPGAPVFRAERVTFLPNGKPFEFVESIIRGDRYSIVFELVKHGAEKRTLDLAAKPALISR